jgi:hypothetical protein
MWVLVLIMASGAVQFAPYEFRDEGACWTMAHSLVREDGVKEARCYPLKGVYSRRLPR